LIFVNGGYSLDYEKLRTLSLNKAVAGNGEFTLMELTNIFRVSKPAGYFQPYMALVTVGGTYLPSGILHPICLRCGPYAYLGLFTAGGYAGSINQLFTEINGTHPVNFQ
jgi:hypothetical protein